MTNQNDVNKLYRIVNVSDYQLMINDISKSGVTLDPHTTSNQSFTEEDIRKSSDLQAFMSQNPPLIKFSVAHKALQVIDGEIAEVSVPSPQIKRANDSGVRFDNQNNVVMVSGTSDVYGQDAPFKIGDEIRIKGPNKFTGKILNFNEQNGRYEIKLANGQRCFSDRNGMARIDDPIFTDENYGKSETISYHAGDLIKGKTLKGHKMMPIEENRSQSASSLINGSALKNAGVKQSTNENGVKEFKMSASQVINTLPKATLPPAVVVNHKQELVDNGVIEENDDFSDNGTFLITDNNGISEEVDTEDVVAETVRSVEVKTEKIATAVKKGRPSNDPFVKEFLAMDKQKQKMAIVRLTAKPKLLKLAKQNQDEKVSTMAYKRLNELGGSEEESE